MMQIKKLADKSLGATTNVLEESITAEVSYWPVEVLTGFQSEANRPPPA